jgi:hypothetical protein
MAAPPRPATTTSAPINQAIRLPDPFIAALFMAPCPDAIGARRRRLASLKIAA